MARNRKKVTYRPSKAQAGLAGGVGVLFILLGLFVVIPTFGLFGVIWTLVAAAITVTNLGQAFGKTYMGPEIHIEEENGEEFSHTPGSAEERMRQLRALYDQRLITPEEYEQKRQEILKDL